MKGTVHMAVSLFQNVILHEQLAPKGSSAAEELLGPVVGVAISELSRTIAKALAPGMEAMQRVLREALKATAKGARHAGGGHLDERGLADSIVAAGNRAAEAFVEQAKTLIDAMPDDQAAADMRMLSALKSSPAVEEASFEDDAQDGQVARGVENQFLESAGAPITGPAEAERIAQAMLQSYKVQRIHVFGTIGDRNDAVDDAMGGTSGKQIQAAEERTGFDEQIKADKKERERASALTNPPPGMERPQRSENEEEGPVG